MQTMNFQTESIGRLRLHVMPTDRFKTFAISLYMGVPLQESTVTTTALIPFVLRRGTERYPTTKQFREKLDDLYGAGFGFDVYKRGDYQLVQFRMDTINDRFVQGEHHLLQQSLQFLGEAITSPLRDGQSFHPKFVNEEKETLRKRIEAIINDKIRYAAERNIEEMYADEPYRLHPLGQLQEIAPIDAQQLYERYEQWLKQSMLDLYIVGDTTMEQVKQAVNDYFRLPEGLTDPYVQRFVHKEVKAVKRVVDRLDVNQGKLNLGLRTKITYVDEQYAAMIMVNGILGGYAHSKLFMNVREKESLAYYASSRYDGHKGLLMIQSGIEIANVERATSIITEQLDAMKAGEISELEMTQTKAMITNQLREIRDSAFEMIGYHFNGVFSGKIRQVEQLIDQIHKVDREAIQAAANDVLLDTIYFLRDKKGESSDANEDV